MTMGERLQRFCDIWIVNEMDCFRLDSIEKGGEDLGPLCQTWEQYNSGLIKSILCLQVQSEKNAPAEKIE